MAKAFTADIYYWRRTWYVQGAIPGTHAEFAANYAKVCTIALSAASFMGALEKVFAMLNRDDSRLATRKMQRMIGRVLKPSPHTSMSVGDVVAIRGEAPMIAANEGWIRLSPTIVSGLGRRKKHHGRRQTS